MVTKKKLMDRVESAEWRIDGIENKFAGVSLVEMNRQQVAQAEEIKKLAFKSDVLMREFDQLAKKYEQLRMQHRDLVDDRIDNDYGGMSLNNGLNLASLQAVVVGILDHLGLQAVPPSRSGFRVQPKPKPKKKGPA